VEIRVSSLARPTESRHALATVARSTRCHVGSSHAISYASSNRIASWERRYGVVFGWFVLEHLAEASHDFSTSEPRFHPFRVPQNLAAAVRRV
jgi:hypothetical protein